MISYIQMLCLVFLMRTMLQKERPFSAELVPFPLWDQAGAASAGQVSNSKGICVVFVGCAMCRGCHKKKSKDSPRWNCCGWTLNVFLFDTEAHAGFCCMEGKTVGMNSWPGDEIKLNGGTLQRWKMAYDLEGMYAWCMHRKTTTTSTKMGPAANMSSQLSRAKRFSLSCSGKLRSLATIQIRRKLSQH